MMNKILVLIAMVLLTSCKSNKDEAFDSSGPDANLKKILVESINETNGDLAGVSLTVISPELGINFSGAHGFDSTTKENILNANQPFRIASLTKTFVSAAILRLQEEGKLDINNSIDTYVSTDHLRILKEGGYDPQQITIKHCMMHVSGLFDYAEGNESYIAEASKDPSKRWTRTEQIQWAMDHGKPMGKPGENFHYSDTGYVLLGEIIERQSGLDLAQGLRQLLQFEKLGMSSTWLESLEDAPLGVPSSVKRYMGDLETTHWDNSVDLYGGGGLQATTNDLALFLQGLFNNQVFQYEETLDIMLLKAGFDSSDSELPEYRLGFGQIKGKESGIEAFLHTGFWGSIFMHFPYYNCSIALNNTNDIDNEVLQRTINYVQWLAEEQGL